MPPGTMNPRMRSGHARRPAPGRKPGLGLARSANRRSRHAAVSYERSPSHVSAPHSPKNRSSWIVRVSSGVKPLPSDARRMPTASISSMNTMHWPPHLAASFLALRAM